MQTALSGLATQLEPEAQRPLALGMRERRFRVDIGNNAIYHGTVAQSLYDDSEVQNLRFGEAYGTRWGEWSWQASVVQRTGGFLDSLIGFWHQNVVPFSDPFFNKIAKNQVKGELYNTGPVLTYGGSVAALTQVTLAAKRALTPELAVRGIVKVPLAGRSAYLDNGAVDLGLGLLGERALTPRWRLHGNLNVVRAGSVRQGALTGGSRWLIGSTVAGEFASSPRLSLVVQAESTTFPYARGLQGGSGRRQQMSFGTWYRQSPTTRWYAAFAENIYPFSVTSYTPDIMVSLGTTRQF